MMTSYVTECVGLDSVCADFGLSLARKGELLDYLRKVCVLISWDFDSRSD